MLPVDTGLCTELVTTGLCTMLVTGRAVVDRSGNSDSFLAWLGVGVWEDDTRLGAMTEGSDKEASRRSFIYAYFIFKLDSLEARIK